jgi:hypothetical protein
MSTTNCTRNILGLTWKQHAWERQVTNSELLEVGTTDQWGRRIAQDYVLCHTQYVCRNCGEVRDDGECGCNRERADKCPVRLASLADAKYPATR